MNFKKYLLKLRELEKSFGIDLKNGPKVILKDKSLYDNWKKDNHALRIKYRQSNNASIPKEDELIIIENLNSTYFFVRLIAIRILDVFPTFSKELLFAAVKAGVKTKNPSANQSFIQSAIRVYDVFKVNQIILDFIKNGTKDEKIGAIRLIYRIRPNMTRRGRILVRKTYEWNGEKYVKKYLEENMEQYKIRVKKMEKERMDFLIKAIEEEMDIDILRDLFIRVPNKIQDFDDEFRDRAEKVFKLKYRELVLNVYEPYRKLNGVSDKAQRTKIWKEQTPLVEKLKIEASKKIAETNK